MRHAVHQRGPARVAANLTPMVDLTFLLIVFFVLVTQITERERVPMELPRPDDPVSAPLPEEQRTIVNLVPDPSAPQRVFAVRVGGIDFTPDPDGLDRLRGHLARLYRDAPALRLNLRADRRAEYRDVEPVLTAVTEAAASAGVPPRVNLVVVREP